MNTLISLAIVASLVGAAVAQTCDSITSSVTGTTLTVTLGGTITGTGTDSVTATITVVAADGTAADGFAADAVASQNFAAAAGPFSAVAVESTVTLVAGKTYNVQVMFPSDGTDIYCPLVCGVTTAAGAGTACPEDDCSAVEVGLLSATGAKITAMVEGTLATGETSATVTLAYTPVEEGGTAVADDAVAAQALPNDFTGASKVTVNGDKDIPLDKEYNVKVSFPGGTYPSGTATPVECEEKCFKIVAPAADGGDNTIGECQSDSDAAAAVSASVFVLVAAFVARAF